MAKIEKLIDPETSAPLVRAYYKGVEWGEGGLFSFSGAKFETLARGGHRADAAEEITYDDLVAVTMLAVEVPAHTALGLLSGPEGRAVTSQLRAIPRLQRLGGVDVEELYDPENPANQLWELLGSMKGMGRTTRSKLMARKRPHLIPVWDSVIGEAMGTRDDHWRWTHEIATEHAHTLAAIRREAGVASGVSLLRILDVTLWMRGAGAGQVKKGTGVDLLGGTAKKAKKTKTEKVKAKAKTKTEKKG
jgi:hypothetical protein